MGQLQGKVAVITGATEGIGLATARLFLREGAHVFITGRRLSILDQRARELGSGVTGIRADSANLKDLDELFATVKAKKEHIDVLHANAGFGELAILGDISESHFDRIVSLNLRGTLFTVQKALPLLKDGSSIILTGSMASIKGFTGASVYHATKAGVRAFARTWVNDLKDRHIRVNVLSPGPVETAIFQHLPDGAREAFRSMIPRGSLGRTEEIAAVALFLASGASSFVNGIELFADGGAAQI